MKKAIAMILALAILFSLCACSNDGSQTPDSSNSSQATTNSTETSTGSTEKPTDGTEGTTGTTQTPTDELTSAPTEEVTTAPTDEPTTPPTQTPTETPTTQPTTCSHNWKALLRPALSVVLPKEVQLVTAGRMPPVLLPRLAPSAAQLRVALLVTDGKMQPAQQPRLAVNVALLRATQLDTTGKTQPAHLPKTVPSVAQPKALPWDILFQKANVTDVAFLTLITLHLRMIQKSTLMDSNLGSVCGVMDILFGV